MVAHATVYSQAGYLQKMQDLQAVVVQPTQIMVLKDLDTEAGQSSSEKSQHHPFTLGKPGCGIEEEAPKQENWTAHGAVWALSTQDLFFQDHSRRTELWDFSRCQRTR